MVSQAERRAATVGGIEDAARKLFAARGFADTTIDDIAAHAGVAKGAVYHHFSSKEEIFTRVVEAVQAELAAAQIPAAPAKLRDPLDMIAAGVLHYLLAISEPAIRRILLIDGPAVLGWQKWRDIDMRYFGALTKAALAGALGDRVPPREIEPLAHLLMGAIMEAALVCATAEEPKKRAKELSAGVRALLGGLVQARRRTA
ncbi:MAG: helix-turn-helix domain-containing protein [Rhizomicrobium sp.]